MRGVAVSLGVALGVASACSREPRLEPIVHYPRPHCPDAGATARARVKVMTLNLRHDADQWERRFAMVADEIVRLDPDVIGMQEVKLSRDQANVLDRLVGERGGARYEVFTAYKSGPGGVASGEGLAILTRWPMLVKESADIGDGRVTLFARIAHPNGVIDAYNTHFDAHRDADGEEMRDREALRTVDFIAKHDECHATFLLGDMNSEADEPPLRRFVAAAFDDSFAAAGAGAPGNTLRIQLEEGAFTQSPRRRVDFVLARTAGRRVATPTESVVCFKNHDAKGFYPSDHFGVMSTFDLGL
ncbi:MAG: endonuclease/exonuclease/phosphatase family protein [Labilithrix sp.]|nr:endonuclease/exonuclease/phosphatase family protein [Labilithrix sp.]MCW5811797.1 endonuclease/exonuclease/phosphatase family protein [Labilithrix sp.]